MAHSLTHSLHLHIDLQCMRLIILHVCECERVVQPCIWCDVKIIVG